MDPLICSAYKDEDGHIVVEAIGLYREGLISHGDGLREAFANFGDAAELYAGEKG